MHIKIAKPWEIPEQEATPEHIYFNRRAFLKAAGVTAFSLIAGCSSGQTERTQTKGTVAVRTDSTRDLYPVEKNPKYTLDRPLTKEEVAAQYNNYYEFTDQKDVYRHIDQFQIRPWTIEVRGMVKKPQVFDIDKLIRQMNLEERLYRHRCVEAWAMAVPWTGFAMADFIKMVEPLSTAQFVRMVSFQKPEEAPGQKRQRWYPWPYFEGLTMREAMNELTFLVTGIYGHPLPVQHGAPIRLSTPWKYGYKSIKGIVLIEFTDRQPATFWNKLAPDEYDFLSNVNPYKPHPRWSQAFERMLGTDERVQTKLFNGYQEYVGKLYV